MNKNFDSFNLDLVLDPCCLLDESAQEVLEKNNAFINCFKADINFLKQIHTSINLEEVTNEQNTFTTDLLTSEGVRNFLVKIRKVEDSFFVQLEDNSTNRELELMVNSMGAINNRNERQFQEKQTLINDKLQESESLLKILTHDLGTPLSVISYASSALEKQNDPSLVKNLNRIDFGVNAIKNIIEQVKELLALESGKKEVSLTNLFIMEVLNQTKDHFLELLQEKGCELIISNKSSTPEPIVIGEKSILIYQVMNNLVSNALKFSFNNSPILITVEDNPTNQNLIDIKVKDFGVDMNEKLLSKVFKVDEKTSRKGTSGEAGTGFGMPIVQSFIIKFGGEIRVESTEKTEGIDNHGTCFTISLKRGLT